MRNPKPQWQGQPGIINHKGYTIIETLITVSLIASLASLSAPSLSSFLRKNEIKTNTILLNASLKLARNHALMQGVDVHLCAIAADRLKRCSEHRDFNASWAKGWLVFADLNDNQNLDSEDFILQVVPNHTTAKIVFNQRGRLRYFPNGTARSAGFYICDSKAEQTIHLRILNTGRTRNHDFLSDEHKKVCAQS